MVSRDTKETALFVAVGVVGFVVAIWLGVSDPLAGAILFGFGIVAPAVRDEWRRRKAG